MKVIYTLKGQDVHGLSCHEYKLGFKYSFVTSMKGPGWTSLGVNLALMNFKCSKLDIYTRVRLRPSPPLELGVTVLFLQNYCFRYIFTTRDLWDSILDDDGAKGDLLKTFHRSVLLSSVLLQLLTGFGWWFHHPMDILDGLYFRFDGTVL